MELTDRESFEVSLTENVTRRTLDPLDEARAFDSYIKKYGWGSEIELSKKIGKSSSYISRRLALLSLRPDQLEKIFRRRKNPSLAEEIIAIDDEEIRSNLIDLSSECGLSSKEIRHMVKHLKRVRGEWTGLQVYRNDEERKYRIMRNAIRKSVVALRVALYRLDEVIGGISEQDWILREILLEQRQALHSQIDLVCNLTKRIEKLSTAKPA